MALRSWLLCTALCVLSIGLLLTSPSVLATPGLPTPTPTPTPTLIPYPVSATGCVRRGTADGPAVSGVTLVLGDYTWHPLDTAVTDGSGCARLHVTWYMPPVHQETFVIYPRPALYTFKPEVYLFVCPPCIGGGTFVAYPRIFLPIIVLGTGQRTS